MDKKTNIDLQNTTQKTRDWATRTVQKHGGWTQVLSTGKRFYLWCESNVKWRFLKIQKHRYNIQSQLIKVCTNTKNLTFSALLRYLHYCISFKIERTWNVMPFQKGGRYLFINEVQIILYFVSNLRKGKQINQNNQKQRYIILLTCQLTILLSNSGVNIINRLLAFN
jgi:hypothetical protein